MYNPFAYPQSGVEEERALCENLSNFPSSLKTRTVNAYSLNCPKSTELFMAAICWTKF